MAPWLVGQSKAIVQADFSSYRWIKRCIFAVFLQWRTSLNELVRYNKGQLKPSEVCANNFDRAYSLN